MGFWRIVVMQRTHQEFRRLSVLAERGLWSRWSACSMRGAACLTSGGIVTAGLRSLCRKKPVLNPKTLGTLVPLILVLSPIPIHQNRAKFFIKIKSSATVFISSFSCYFNVSIINLI